MYLLLIHICSRIYFLSHFGAHLCPKKVFVRIKGGKGLQTLDRITIPAQNSHSNSNHKTWTIVHFLCWIRSHRWYAQIPFLLIFSAHLFWPLFSFVCLCSEKVVSDRTIDVWIAYITKNAPSNMFYTIWFARLQNLPQRISWYSAEFPVHFAIAEQKPTYTNLDQIRESIIHPGIRQTIASAQAPIPREELSARVRLHRISSFSPLHCLFRRSDRRTVPLNALKNGTMYVFWRFRKYWTYLHVFFSATNNICDTSVAPQPRQLWTRKVHQSKEDTKKYSLNIKYLRNCRLFRITPPTVQFSDSCALSSADRPQPWYSCASSQSICEWVQCSLHPNSG